MCIRDRHQPTDQTSRVAASAGIQKNAAVQIKGAQPRCNNSKSERTASETADGMRTLKAFASVHEITNGNERAKLSKSRNLSQKPRVFTFACLSDSFWLPKIVSF